MKKFKTLILASMCFGQISIADAPEDAMSDVQQDAQQLSWAMPKTEHGFPDLQGTWFFGSRTPMQRPVDLGLQKNYTTLEAEQLVSSMRERLQQWDQPLDPNRDAPELGAQIRQEADDAFLGHYVDPVLIPIDGEYRTSVVYQPADGRIPYRSDFRDFHARRRASGLQDADGPEGQTLSGRWRSGIPICGDSPKQQGIRPFQ